VSAAAPSHQLIHHIIGVNSSLGRVVRNRTLQPEHNFLLSMALTIHMIQKNACMDMMQVAQQTMIQRPTTATSTIRRSKVNLSKVSKVDVNVLFVCSLLINV
jgi:hypothetical protein